MQLPKPKPETVYATVTLATVGEFCIAAWLFASHGDAFPLYLASLYFVRERFSAFHYIAARINARRGDNA